MALVTEEGILKVSTPKGYSDKITVLDNNNTGSFFVGTVHVPKIYIGKKALLQITFLEE